MSWSRTPDTRPTTPLKTSTGARRVQGSRRRAFQPETRSKPSSSLASRRGISAGSSWRSPSIVTITSPWACANPPVSAAALPKFRRRRTTRTFGARRAAASARRTLPSVEPSSTKTASHWRPARRARPRARRTGARRCAPRCGPGRRRRSRALGIAYAAPVAALPTIEEALALVLERVRPLPPSDVPLEAAARARPRRAGRRRGRPAAVPELRDGRVRRARRRHARDAPDRRPDRRGPALPTARSRRARRWRSRPAGVVPEGADAVVPIEDVRRARQPRRDPRRDEPGAHVRPRGGDVRAGEAFLEAGTRLGPRRSSARWPPPASRGARRAPAPRRDPRHRHRAPPAGRAARARARSTSRTASCSPPSSPGAGAEVERLQPVADDEDAHREALERGLEADCS